MFDSLPLPHSDSIRLIEIQPGYQDDTLSLKLFVTSSSERPKYTALSYVWGDPKITEKIKCNGHSLTVTTNLAAALRHLRLAEKCSEPIWIDAICINQNDDDEKGHQVMNMASIYKKAFLVVAWLGPWSRQAEQAFGLLNGIAEHPGILRRVDFSEHGPFECLEFFANVEWLTRTWTIQELGLARRVVFMLGHYQIGSKCLYRAIKATLRRLGFVFGKARTVHLYRFLDILELWNGVSQNGIFRRPQNYSFLSLLVTARSRRAADPRDKVFALLSHPCARTPFDEEIISATAKLPLHQRKRRIAVEFQQRLFLPAHRKPVYLKPVSLLDLENTPEPRHRWRRLTHKVLVPLVGVDYTKSLEEVYTETAWAIIYKDRNLDILSHVHNTRAELNDVGWPSWVPRWDREPDWRICSLNKLLQNPFHESSPWEYRTGLRPLKLLGRSGFEAKMIRDDGMSCHSLTGIFGINIDKIGRRVEPEKWAKLGPLHFSVKTQLAELSRVYFSTALLGFIGLGPEALEVGDFVFVLHGAKVPIVLRRSGDPSSGRYRVVGECYVERFTHAGDRDAQIRRFEGVLLEESIILF